MWTRLRRRVGVVLGVTLLLTGGGVAVASWTATGTGQGSARAASVSGLVVDAGSPVGALYPLPADTTPATGYGSGTVGSVATTVTNPNPFPVTITSATVGSVTASRWAAGPAPPATCCPPRPHRSGSTHTGSCRGAVSDGVSGVHVPADPGAGTRTCTDTTTLDPGSAQCTVAPVRGRWVGKPLVGLDRGAPNRRGGAAAVSRPGPRPRPSSRRPRGR